MYDLTVVQLEKVCSALLEYESKRKSSENIDSESKKTNLLEDEQDDIEPVWLQLATLKFIGNNRKLIPYKIAIKNPVIPSSSEACLIVKDPQRVYKDLVNEAGLSKVVTRVIGLSKLKAKWNSYEQKRQLRDQFDIFLADDRVIPMLPRILGKTFYQKSKVPVPVKISKGTAEQLKREVVSAYGATYFNSAPCSSFMIKCGHVSNTSTELAENVESILQFVSKHIVPDGAKGIASIHLKTSQSIAIPLWNNPNLKELIASSRKVVTKETASSKRKSDEESLPSQKKQKKVEVAKESKDSKQQNVSDKKQVTVKEVPKKLSVKNAAKTTNRDEDSKGKKAKASPKVSQSSLKANGTTAIKKVKAGKNKVKH